MFCPAEGTEPLDERTRPPTAEEDFKLWAARTYASEQKYYGQLKILLQCWENEQKRKAGD